jgi:hypothetical protein
MYIGLRKNKYIKIELITLLSSENARNIFEKIKMLAKGDCFQNCQMKIERQI